MDRTRSKMLDAIRRAPANANLREVFGDWLQSNGEPWGELIGIQRAKHRGLANEQQQIRERALRAEFEEPIFARCDKYERPGLRWWLGFVDAATFRKSRGLGELLRDERGTMLRALGLESSLHHGGMPEAIEVLETLGAPRLVSLTAGSARLGDAHPPPLGALGRLWGALPAIKALEIRSPAYDLGDFEVSERLRRLSLELPDNDKVWGTLLNARFPQLERLWLWLGDAPESLRPLTRLLTAARFPCLKELGLIGYRLANALALELHGWELLPQLTLLDLSEGTLNDGGAEGMFTNPGAFAHLARLDVAGNPISLDVAERLSELCPSIDAAAGGVVVLNERRLLTWRWRGRPFNFAGAPPNGPGEPSFSYRNRRWFLDGRELKCGERLTIHHGHTTELVFVDTAEAAREAMK